MIRAVIFDAVGTVMEATPSIAASYAAAGRRHGATLPDAQVHALFQQAFADQEALDHAVHGGRTSEAREAERWHAIVNHVFAGALPPEVIQQQVYHDLWHLFAAPSCWRVLDDVAECWQSLKQRGLPVAVASNFDSRLDGICQALEPLNTCQQVFVSSRLGHKKPSRQFFASVQEQLQLEPTELLLVGDDPDNDYGGALAANWHALLVDRAGRFAGREDLAAGRIASLAQVTDYLDTVR